MEGMKGKGQKYSETEGMDALQRTKRLAGMDGKGKDAMIWFGKRVETHVSGLLKVVFFFFFVGQSVLAAPLVLSLSYDF